MSSYTTEEVALNEAIQYKKDHPNVSFRWLQKNFGPNKDRINRRWNKTHVSKSQRPAPNKKLNKAQELAFTQYLRDLNAIGVPLRRKNIDSAANQVLASSYSGDGPPPVVGEHWAARWLKDNQDFDVIIQKTLEIERKKAADKVIIAEFYRKIEQVTKQFNIQAIDIWNMDETGLRIGIGRGQWVVVPVEDSIGGNLSRFHSQLGHQFCTEHVTVVEAISAGGVTIDPLIIVQGIVIQERWFHGIKSGDIAITVSDSGYANDYISFLWLQHFNTLSKRHQQGEYRLLILDGYDSHLTLQFLQFCEQNKIIVAQLPPHSTHLLQPLDVVVFQQWKHWHAESLDYHIRHGVGEFNRQTFLANIESIRTNTMKPNTIKSAFRRCGIMPFRPSIVLRQLDGDETLLLSPSHPMHPSQIMQVSQNQDSDSDLPSSWSTPNDAKKLRKQANAIIELLRSSITPPDTPTRLQNRQNIAKFRDGTIAMDININLKINYMWTTQISKKKDENRRNYGAKHVQKGGIVYAKDVDRDISWVPEFPTLWKQMDLDSHQKVLFLLFQGVINPQLRLIHKERRKLMDNEAVKVVTRVSRWAKKNGIIHHDKQPVLA
jgi:hypothetical protein